MSEGAATAAGRAGDGGASSTVQQPTTTTSGGAGVLRVVAPHAQDVRGSRRRQRLQLRGYMPRRAPKHFAGDWEWKRA